MLPAQYRTYLSRNLFHPARRYTPSLESFTDMPEKVIKIFAHESGSVRYAF
jgi:hypothetical protein